LLRKQRLGHARRPAEKSVEPLIRHRQARAVIEIILVEPQRTVLAYLNQVLINEVHILGLTVRGEPHHFVLPGIHLEASIVGKCTVEKTERMREPNLLGESDLVALTISQGSCCPFAHS